MGYAQLSKLKRFSDIPGFPEISHWAIAALGCGAFAVLSANIAGLIAPDALSALHATRAQAVSHAQLRAQVLDLRQDNARLASEYRTLQTRFNLLDDGSSETIRRLGAVERSLPLLIESLPLGSDIDRSVLTASIVEAGGEVYEVEGGTMVVRQSPLFGAAIADQPMPPVVIEADVPRAPAANAIGLQGIAVGPYVPFDETPEAYRTITAAAGPLLLGTRPLAIDTGTGLETRVVLGPLPDAASADALCARLSRLDLACEPAEYEGLPLPL